MLDTSDEIKARTLSRGLSAALDAEQKEQEQEQKELSAAAAMINKDSVSSSNGHAAGGYAPKGDNTAAAAAAAAAAAVGDGEVKEGLELPIAPGFSMSLNLLRVDGGAAHNNTLMQLQVSLIGDCRVVSTFY